MMPIDLVNTALVGLIGLAVGSFLNVLVDRVPARQSLLWPPSHCPGCDTRLRPLDLIPAVSYIALRGRCRYCRARIPGRVLAVELAAGALFAGAWALHGPSIHAAVLAGFGSLFLVVSVIDIERGTIPNRLVIAGLAMALAVAPFLPDLGILASLAGTAIGFGAFLAIWLLPARAIGEGDVKLAAVAGALTGMSLVVLALGVAFVVGGLVAAVLLASGRLKRGGRLPFGPFLATGAMVALAWGDPLVAWYLGAVLGL